MTSRAKRRASAWPLILTTAALSLPGIVLRFSGANVGVITQTALYGLAIVAAAFLIGWAAEAAEVDVSQGIAVAAVALIAVLPEYAVSMSFAWKAGHDPQFAHYAVANMTGGNRLLIGAAWPVVFFIFWGRARRPVLALEHGHAIEVIALAAAALYSFVLPLKGNIGLYDAVILVGIFVTYVYLISRVETEEPELIGPSRTIGMLPKVARRLTIIGLFVYAAAAIVLSADPFAEGLVHTGTQLGIDQFLLVQWIAPLASEAPEFLFAGIVAWRGRAPVGLGVVLSSAVNQWTLLVGCLPIAYDIAGKSLRTLPLDGRQNEEVLLTAAQCAFAVALMLNLKMSALEATLLLSLFVLQFVIPNETFRLTMAVGYLAAAIVILIWQRRDIVALFRLARAVERDGGEASL